PDSTPLYLHVALPISGQTLALGQVFFADGARRGRRNGEPFRTAVRIPEAELDASEGFRVRISGRITRSRGYGPVGCRQPASSGQDRKSTRLNSSHVKI